MMLTDDEYARRVTRYEAMKRLLIVFIAVVVSLVLGAILVLVNQMSERGKENHRLLTTVQDCTQPSGKCYQDGQKRTASAVSDINRVIILAAACSAGVPPDLSVQQRETQIQSCVIERLSRAQHKR